MTEPVRNVVYHAVYYRTGPTGDQPLAIFRYGDEAQKYALAYSESAKCTVERVALDLDSFAVVSNG